MKKKSITNRWFKPVVSGLLAVVTIVGALVAWRANVASNEAGDEDSKGILALQNAEETTALSYIEANGHQIAYVDYLRNRKLAISMLTDDTLTGAAPEEQPRIERQITETLDLASTSKVYFFPGRYLNQDDEYDFPREIAEYTAQAEQKRDLNFQQHFDLSDNLSNKAMSLLATLILLSISLSLLAISEILSSGVKYVTALSGIVYMVMGSAAAYLLDTGQASQADVAAVIWPGSWLVAGITLLALVVVGGLVILLGRRRTTASNTFAVIAPAQQGDTQLSQPAILSEANYPPSSSLPITVTMPPQAASTESVSSLTAREEMENEEAPFKRMVTVLIATVALIAAIIAYLQTDASNQSGSANRSTQQFALQALGQRTYGASEMTYQYSTVTQAWAQLRVLAVSAQAHDDTAATKRYQDVKDEISRISGINGIFDKAYFDPDLPYLPDESAYAADLYARKTAGLSERSSVQSGLHGVWDAKSGAYIANLTMLAVALALFGLSLTTSGFVRYIFTGAGLLMVGVTFVWAVSTYIQPVKSINDQAIDAYARGIGLSKSGNTADAIMAFDEALGAQPGYANALVERANAHLDRYREAYFSGYNNRDTGQEAEANVDFQQSLDELAAAIKDYEAAETAGRDDPSVRAEHGWCYYLLGKYEDAIKQYRYALDRDPNVVRIRLRLGLALLAAGQYDAAQGEYNTAIARASDQINNALDSGKAVSSDFWFFLEASVADLDKLIDRMDKLEYSFTEAPPLEQIASPVDTEDEAYASIEKLKNKIAAFEYLATQQKMPVDTGSAAEVEPFTFTATIADQAGEIEGHTFPYNTKGVIANYSYKGIEKGQNVQFKVFQNYQRYPEYDFQYGEWEYPEEGEKFIEVTDPYDIYSEAYYQGAGLWNIEMYVDYKIVRRGFFYIQTEDETIADQQQTTP